jgi:glucokinase
MTEPGGQVLLGIEIGGAKLQAALGRGDGILIHRERLTVDPGAGREGICRQLEFLLPPLIATAGNELAGIGIGFGGPVDATAGRIVISHQVEGWKDFPIADWIARRVGKPAVLGNDSDLAGWGEALFGAGRGKSPVVYMNIGSGIGGAIVLEGRLYAGQGCGSAEIGHTRFLSPSHFSHDHEPSPAPRTKSEDAISIGPSLEEVAAGFALDRAAVRALGRAEARAFDLVQAVREGVPAAVAEWNRALAAWSTAIANAITLLCPRVFVLGGGVSMVGDLLFDALRREVEARVFAPFRGKYELLPAALGEEVVLHGALKLARDRFGEQTPAGTGNSEA